MSVFSGRVKLAVSGDTIALVPVNSQGLSQERMLSLAYVAGPRMATDPYGYEAREYLRNLLVGKTVKCRVLYTINGRDYGDVSAPIFDSLIERCLQDGVVKLRDDSSAKPGFEAVQAKLEAAQERAHAANLRSWNSSIKLVTNESEAPEELFQGSAYDAVIERAIGGDRLQVRVPLKSKGKVHFVGQAVVAGIRTPKSVSPDSPAEPYGDAAKAFVTVRLLQRSVQLKFLDKTPNGIPIVQVIHPAGDIAEHLLANGLASVLDRHSGVLGAASMSALRKAEKGAKDAQLNLWKGAVGATAKAAANDVSSFDAVISRVLSSDTFYVRRMSNEDEELTVQLSSLRAPRKNDPATAKYSGLAKEFARSQFIGKKVQVRVDAVRPKSEHFEERNMVTITLNQGNIALKIVEAGWAGVIRHRKDDDSDRSPIWDELIEAETAAKAAGKGIHSKKPVDTDFAMPVDVSESQGRAQSYLKDFERQNKISAVVDFISSGGRLRLITKRTNLLLTLVMSGVRVPRTNEPFGDAALSFVSKRVMQRDVLFSVNGVDKTGAFIGHVYILGSQIPIAVSLVKEGLAEVHEASARYGGYADLLTEAGNEAKSQRKGLWFDFVEAAPAAVEAVVENNSAAAAPQYVDVTLTAVDPVTGHISYRLRKNDDAYTQLLKDLTSFNSAAMNQAQFAFSGPIRRNTLVSVKSGSSFSRAKVLTFEKDAFTVADLDTGATKVVSKTVLRPLPSQFASSSPLATTATLSFVQRPPGDYLEDYVKVLQSFVGKSLAAVVDSPPHSDMPAVSLYEAGSKGRTDSINTMLVYEGYGFVKKLSGWETSEGWKSMVDALNEMQEGARKEHIGIWEFGDVRDDDDD